MRAVRITRHELDELREVWRERPGGGLTTKRERQAWANGFNEALDAIGGPALQREVTGSLWPDADAAPLHVEVRNDGDT